MFSNENRQLQDAGQKKVHVTSPTKKKKIVVLRCVGVILKNNEKSRGFEVVESRRFHKDEGDF